MYLGRKIFLMLKEQIYQACLDRVAHNIETLQASICAAQETSSAETKSSAGDKYETTRAMMQIEIESYTKRLVEAQKLQMTLLQIPWQDVYEWVKVGSLVTTNQGVFFIAIGIGQLSIEGRVYFVVSPASPIGACLLKKKVHDTFTFLQKKYEILAIA
jgi:hypothetical protein